MNFKRFNGSTWETVQHKIYGSGTDSLTAFPAMIQAAGEPLTDYTILGNTVQNGTPTPENPVVVQSCVDRTAQLIPYPFYTESGTVNGIEWTVYGDGRVTATGTTTKGTNLYFINASSGFSLKAGTYTMKFYGNKNRKILLRDIDNNVVLASISGTTTEKEVTFTLESDSGACSLYFNEPTTGAVFNIDGYLMLNEGSTALPYEPYGYKIPIAVNDTEYPIYLGQVEATRKIKKLVLTGEESWTASTAWKSTNTSVFYTTVSGANNQDNNVRYVVSDRFISSSRNEVNSGDTDMIGLSARNALTIRISDNIATTLTEFQTYLSTQYTNGTPVTVWYVLAAPETGIVNEPLMKIGNYADTISFAQAGATILTSDGDNTITFGTTVQPSAMSATFKGWHLVRGAKQYDGNDWR